MHRIDVAYCYRCRAFRCPYVSFCVGHMGEPCKTAEPIKMLLVAGRLARVQGTTFACFFLYHFVMNEVDHMMECTLATPGEHK